MHAHKLPRTQPRLQRGDSFTQDMGGAGHVQAYVISCRFRPVDFIWLQADDLAIRFDDDALGSLLTGFQVSQHFQDAALKGAVGRML